MSIEEFSKTIKDRIFKGFINYRIKGEDANPLYIRNLKPIRSIEQTRQGGTDFIIGEDTIKQIHKLLSKEYGATRIPTIGLMWDRLLKLQQEHKATIHKIKKPDGGIDTTVLFTGVSFGKGISSIVEELVSFIDKEHTKNLYTTIIGKGGQMQKGHVVGIPTNTLAQALNTVDTLETKYDTTIEFIESLINDLKKADIASSNYRSERIYSYLGRYTKSPNIYLVELQLTKANRDSGEIIKKALVELRNQLIGSSEDIYHNLLHNIAETSIFANTMIKMRGSPSMLELIERSVLEALDPEKYPPINKRFNVGPVEIAKFTSKVSVDKSKLKESLQKEINRLKNTKARLVRESSRIRNQSGQFYSLTNLQILLQARLADQIKQNMGTGDRRDILNLRSGRFAESVKIQRLTMQRDQAISIFYNYMYYPYKTFEPGGAQGTPASRNPVTLINRSIREIATTLVDNRLRLTRL